MNEKTFLFDPDRHETLAARPWSEDAVASALREIYDGALAAFDPVTLWPKDPEDTSPVAVEKTVYGGASGSLWALAKLADFLQMKLPFDKANLIASIYQQYLAEPDTESVVPSLFLGEAGILLVHHEFAPSPQIEDRLFQAVKENAENPVLEALWGSPGTMLAAAMMYEKTKARRWLELYLENVDFLLATWNEVEGKGYSIWTQNLYGKTLPYVGAAHGFMGNVFPLLRHLHLLAADVRETILAKTVDAVKALAVEDHGLVNWPAVDRAAESKWLVQWCHGAAGAVTSLASAGTAELDEVLMKAGALIWQAGPLQKKASLCHGTDGNGFAFLKLYRRTGASVWLDRARAFAMHAATQRNGRYTLFTGELGLALYLMACLKGDDRFPFLEFV